MIPIAAEGAIRMLSCVTSGKPFQEKVPPGMFTVALRVMLSPGQMATSGPKSTVTPVIGEQLLLRLDIQLALAVLFGAPGV
jgi:hypothetical protein